MRVAIWQCFALVARLTSHSSVFRAFAAILYYLPQPVQLWANSTIPACPPRRSSSVKSCRSAVRFRSRVWWDMPLALTSPTNAAVQKYLNLKKVPQLFITTGASRFGDPKVFPWTMAFMPGYAAERDEFACRWMVDRDRKITRR